MVVLSLYLFVGPGLILVNDLHSPTLASGAIPGFAFTWHRKLSAEFVTWARQRVASGKAKDLSLQNIPATEWPLFSQTHIIQSLADGSEITVMLKEIAAIKPRDFLSRVALISTEPRRAIRIESQMDGFSELMTIVQQQWLETHPFDPLTSRDAG